MKKTYQSPQMDRIQLEEERVLALSSIIDPKEPTVEPGDETTPLPFYIW